MRTSIQCSKTMVSALLLTILLASNGFAQDEPARFILKLNDSLISSFKDFGSLRSELPPDVRDRIETVELRFAGTEGEDPVTMNLEVKLQDGNAEISVDDSLLETLRKQPVRIPLEGKTFNLVFLRYDNEAKNSDDEILMGDGPNRFVLDIIDDSSIAGSVMGLTSIEMATSFGKIELKLDQIAGVRFKSDGNGAAVVFLNNGDSITGTPNLSVVNVQTFWGLAEVNIESIRSMAVSPSARFVQEATDFGTRWNLRTGLAPGRN